MTTSIGVCPEGLTVYVDGKPVLTLGPEASKDLAIRIIRNLWIAH